MMSPHYLTLGPQRGPFVAQQISVLHMLQRIQSQPSLFWTTILQEGHGIASPSSTIFCSGGRGGGREEERRVRRAKKWEEGGGKKERGEEGQRVGER